MQPDTEWTIVEPGVITMPTTQFRIVKRPNSILFDVFHGDTTVSVGCNLMQAKQDAARYMGDLLAVGIEP